MRKKSSRIPEQPKELELFEKLRPYVDAIAKYEIKKGKFYQICIRASFVKCFQFNLLAWNEEHSKSSFFWLPSLRGICEDILVLNYVNKMTPKEKEDLITGLMQHELHTRLVSQFDFFSQNRQSQPVIPPRIDAVSFAKLEDEIRDIWKKNGWPGMNKKAMPPVRDMALKDGGHTLETLYDYIYRLTSGTVHFSVQGLLRTGWGDLPAFTFSTENFSGYYASFGRIYGAYLFCCYFDMFARFLRPGKANSIIVNEIRHAVYSSSRWPEMVTFEEMNLTVPNFGLLERMNEINKFFSLEHWQDLLTFILNKRATRANPDMDEKREFIKVSTGHSKRVVDKLKTLSDDKIVALFEKITKNEINSLVSSLDANGIIRVLATLPAEEASDDILDFLETIDD